jgi:hypothetical protein
MHLSKAARLEGKVVKLVVTQPAREAQVLFQLKLPCTNRSRLVCHCSAGKSGQAVGLIRYARMGAGLLVPYGVHHLLLDWTPSCNVALTLLFVSLMALEV